MYKNGKFFRGVIICVLLFCTLYLLYSVLSNPLGKQDNRLALAVTAGFILLGTDKSVKKGR